MHTCSLCRVQTLHPQIYWLDLGFLLCGYESIIPFELVATNIYKPYSSCFTEAGHQLVGLGPKMAQATPLSSHEVLHIPSHCERPTNSATATPPNPEDLPGQFAHAPMKALLSPDRGWTNGKITTNLGFPSDTNKLTQGYRWPTHRGCNNCFVTAMLMFQMLMIHGLYQRVMFFFSFFTCLIRINGVVKGKILTGNHGFYHQI